MPKSKPSYQYRKRYTTGGPHVGFLVITGREPGLYHDAVGCYKAIEGFPEAEFYYYESMHIALLANHTKDLSGGKRLNKRQLINIINTPKILKEFL